ncbi:MAG TPA: hypothetical protein VFP59_03180 [Candidatus Angelobacter sp.]|nr:hypothetical protein [Candidatus Angelobacter sp.]
MAYRESLRLITDQLPFTPRAEQNQPEVVAADPVAECQKEYTDDDLQHSPIPPRALRRQAGS